MKHLYSCTANEIEKRETVYEIKEEKPTLLKAYPSQKMSIKSCIENIYWYLITSGRYRVFCAYDGNTAVHTSYVVPRCFKFPFLNETSYEIGPCNTNADYRGKGIYPAVLSKIVQTDIYIYIYYMIIDELNTPSIRGALKAGFKILPGEIKKDKIKRYIYVQED